MRRCACVRTRTCLYLCIFAYTQVERLRQILRDLIPEHLVARILSAPGRQARADMQ